MTGTRSGPPGKSGGADAKVDREALDRLGAQIDAARSKLEGPRKPRESKYHALTLAWRMVLELVIGLAIGVGLGYALDEVAGTKPLFMVVFGMFGLAAGVKTMMASAKQIARQAEQAAEAVEEGSSRGER